MGERAVLFDFHGTLAQVEEPAAWVVKAAAACGVDLPPAEAGGLASALVRAGRAGGPLPDAVPPHVADAWERRDLAADAHRACYTGLAGRVPTRIAGLPTALYERLLTADGWHLYTDTLPVLRALRAGGVRVAVVSNVGFDLRPVARDLGIDDLVDAYALSYEVGMCKPAPEIFRAACARLEVEPADAVMVGDTPADAGAVGAGCRCLILPASPPAAEHGLGAVLGLVGLVSGPDAGAAGRTAPRRTPSAPPSSGQPARIDGSASRRA
jgi:HAD superfamily hydrolase (TIGR01509 family)